MQVRDQDEHGPILSRLCGNDSDTAAAGLITSKSNRLWIKFRTDSSAHGRGFYAVYTSGRSSVRVRNNRPCGPCNAGAGGGEGLEILVPALHTCFHDTVVGCMVG